MKKLDIKRALREHNMTQVELCKKTGLLTQNMSPIINGNPTISKLFQIAEGIGCDIPDLFYPDPAEEAKEEEIPMEAGEENVTAKIPDTSDKDAYLLHGNGLLIEGQNVSTENEPQGGAAKVETFCPHCGKKVRVGVVLLPEQC